MKTSSNGIILVQPSSGLLQLSKDCLNTVKVTGLLRTLILMGMWLFPSLTYAQEISQARITLDQISRGKLVVQLKTSIPRADWSFRNSYGPLLGLGERVQSFKSIDSMGQSHEARMLAPGQFVTPEKVTAVSYEINVSLPSRAADTSHISWVNKDLGLLMLADLLPVLDSASPSSVELTLPAGWRAFSSAKSSGPGFLIDDIEETVIIIGRSLRERRMRVDSTSVVFLTADEWKFSDEDASKMAAKMIRFYSTLTKRPLTKEVLINLLPFPQPRGNGAWSAETRGNNVLLFMDSGFSKRQSLDRLGIILTHEVFHLWIPNSFPLQGDYDWFYEGFTLYLALRTALRVGLIDFQEYLNTLGRVYDSYLATPDRDDLSLIDMSRRRWTSFPSLVYEKGMLVAFIYDLRLRELSEGRLTLDDLYRNIFNFDYKGVRDANEAIISLLNRPAGLEDFAGRYIQNPTSVNLEALLTPYGIRVERADFRTRLSVPRNTAKQHRKLLRSLGYRD